MNMYAYDVPCVCTSMNGVLRALDGKVQKNTGETAQPRTTPLGEHVRRRLLLSTRAWTQLLSHDPCLKIA